MTAQRTPTTGARRYGPVLMAAAFCLLHPGQASAQKGSEAEKVGDTRQALTEWVETRRIISKEKSDWELGREMMQNRIDLVKREIESLRTRIGEAEQSIGKAEEERDKLLAEKEELVQSSSALSSIVASLEQRAKELLPRLPQPLRTKLQPISQLLPEKPEETKRSLGERFLTVVGMLNEIDRFNREITVTSEVRPLGDGTTAEVTTMYIGIGQGYYVNARENAAGIGTATADGWVWTPANDAAAAIAKAIAIHRNEEVADFVRLPVRIQ